MTSRKARRMMAVSYRLSSFCLLLFFTSCKTPVPIITFTAVPVESLGGAHTTGTISGLVSDSKPGDQVMIFARANAWWVQPDVHTQLTPIDSSGKWTREIHLGTDYAVALIRGSFQVKESLASLPGLDEHVRAITTVRGTPTLVQQADHTSRVLHFSGYDWENTYHVDDYSAIDHYYLPQNADVDPQGRMHLRIKRLAGQWTCAEAKLPRTLGYGTYRLTFDAPKQLDPAAEFAFYTYSADKAAGNHREIELHLSRWGEPSLSNAEYVIEPYDIAANVHRFELEAGKTISVLHWSPGKAAYSTSQLKGGKSYEVTHWTFSAGVPTTKDEQVYLGLCPFGYPKQPEKDEAEFIVDSFEFLP